MSADSLYVSLSFAVAFLSAILDLLQVFSASALRRAIGWVLLYGVFAGVIAILVFFFILNVDVTIGSVIATPFIKALFSGLLFKPLIQSRLFMLKTKELDEPNYGPAATYEKFANIVKKQISLASVVTNVEVMSSYLDSGLPDLKRKAFAIIYAHEVWTDDEKRNQTLSLDTELSTLPTSQEKKLRLARFIQQNGGASLDIVERFQKKINLLSEAKLRDTGEKLLQTISDPVRQDYFKRQLNEPNVKIQTVRKLIITYCSDTKFMEQVISNRHI